MALSMTNNIVLTTKNISKIYPNALDSICIFKDVNFTLHAGEIVALMGPSGSGKTSFLNILGLLDTPTDGELLINGISTKYMSDTDKTKLRAKNIGFVFQFHHLLPDFTAIENVMLPLLKQNISSKEAKQRANSLLTAMLLGHRCNHYPSMLSGGEQQRIAIARAIACNPSILIADETTGNLDKNTAMEIFNIMTNLAHEQKIAIILATHDNNLYSNISNKLKIENQGIVKEYS